MANQKDLIKLVNKFVKHHYSEHKKTAFVEHAGPGELDPIDKAQHEIHRDIVAMDRGLADELHEFSPNASVQRSLIRDVLVTRRNANALQSAR